MNTNTTLLLTALAVGLVAIFIAGPLVSHNFDGFTKHSSHGHGPSLENANKDFYAKMANMYDKFAGQAAFHKLLERELPARSKWIGIEIGNKQLRVLDYACGTGVLSQVLSPFSQQILGIDLSKEMIEKYNEKATRLGTSDKMTGVVGNLISDKSSPATELDNKEDKNLYNFDLVVVGLGFHHFGDLEQAVKGLSERLRPGGVLCIVDFGPHEEMKMPGQQDRSHSHSHSHSHQHQGHLQHGSNGHSHGHGQSQNGAHAVAHSGFGKDDVVKLFNKCGLKDSAVEDLASGFVWGPPPMEEIPEEDRAQFKKYMGMMTIERDIFIARGTKV